MEKEINDLNEKTIQEKLDKETYKEVNANLYQKIVSMEKNISFLMEQHKKDEIQKENFIIKFDFLMEQHKNDIDSLKKEIKNIQSQRKADLDYIMNLLKNKTDKNQISIIISSEVENIKKEIEILHKRSEDLVINLHGLKNEVDMLKIEKEILTGELKRALDNGLHLKSLINNLDTSYDDLKIFLNKVNEEMNIIINELISIEQTLNYESNFVNTLNFLNK